MLTTAYRYEGPAAVRYPRGGGMGVQPETGLETLAIGKGEVRRRGEKIAILAFGSLLPAALKAGEQLNATVVNMRFVKPIDADLIKELAATHELLVSVEENALVGGGGAEIARVVDGCTSAPRLLRLGLPDSFVDHGDQAILLAEVGLDADGLVRSIGKATAGKK
jgi:1-deoxy-D-xylulose-5-phosphate synthase